MLRVANLLLCLASCGRVGFDVAGDAAGQGDADAGDGCDPEAAFGEPQLIAELSDPTSNDGTLRVFPDELSGYFWSYRAGETSQIFYASRADRSASWTVTPTVGLEDGENDVDPAPASDGSILVFRKSAPDRIYYAIPVSPTKFELPVEVTAFTSPSGEMQPFITGSDVLFNSRRSGGGDLYAASRSGTDFDAPQVLSELATPGDEGDPLLTADRATLYFRRADPGSDDYEIYVAKREGTNRQFGPATRVAGVNAEGAADGPSSISPDGCRLYISSNRAGTFDIYVATRGR